PFDLTGVLMTQHLNADAGFASATEPELLEPPLATSTSGDTNTFTAEFFNLENKGLYTGFWRCEPGESRWEFTENGEIIHVISGRMTVTEDGGQPVEVGPGDAVAFPIGWRGNWSITETLSKFYVIYE